MHLHFGKALDILQENCEKNMTHPDHRGCVTKPEHMLKPRRSNVLETCIFFRLAQTPIQFCFDEAASSMHCVGSISSYRGELFRSTSVESRDNLFSVPSSLGLGYTGKVRKVLSSLFAAFIFLTVSGFCWFSLPFGGGSNC
jgi:hypothetical protein